MNHFITNLPTVLLNDTTGATLACGTGACAVVVAAVLEGRAGRVSRSCVSII